MSYYEDDDEFEEVNVRFFTPLDVEGLFQEAIADFGIILSEELKNVQGNDKLPKHIAYQIKRLVKDTVINDAYQPEELQEEIADLLTDAGVPDADEVAENTIARWIEELKRLLKRKKKKRGGE